MNRNIIFTKKDTAELIDKPMPEVHAGEVRVKLVRSAISSGTERSNLTGVPDGGCSIFQPDDGTVTWPRQAGYSSSGYVDAVGTGVTSVKPGDRVALSWTLHSEYIVVPENRVYRLPDEVSFEAGALVHISTFPMAAVRKCRLEVGEGAIVMGQGVLGQLAVMILHAAGAAPVIAADPDAAKRRQALKIGADYALDPFAADFAEQAKALTDNEHETFRGMVRDRGPKVGIEVTGNGGALDNVLDAIAPFGRIALLGCTRNSNFTIDYYHKVHGRGVSLIGAHTLARTEGESFGGLWTTRDDARAFIRLMALGRISLDGFVSEVHSPAACGEVFARLAKGGAFPVVEFDWTQLG